LFRRFGRVAPTFRLNLKKIFLGFNKNVFCKSHVPRKGVGTLYVGEKRNSFNDLFGKT